MTNYSNIEAEQIIFGTAILNNAYLSNVADILEEKHFFYNEHKLIWNQFIKIGQEGGIANPTTLRNFMNDTEGFNHLGGVKYLGVLLDQATGIVDIRHYAKLLIELWQKRELEILFIKGLDDLKDKNFDHISSEIENDMSGLAFQEAKKKTQHISEIISDIELEDEQGLSDKFTPTGFSKLDDIMSGGIYNKQLCIIGARPSVGKAQPLNSNILTVNGWKKMGDIELGDKLASIDGKESKVVAIYPQGVKKIYTVTFRDDRKVECCDEHLWQVYFRTWDKPRVINTKRLMEMLESQRYKNRLWIDEFNGDFGKSKDLPIDPWILGALIGDGGLSSGGINFTNSSQEIINKLKNKLEDKFLLKKRSKKCVIDYSIIQPKTHKNELLDKLRDLELTCKSYEKFIPDLYLESNKHNRLELLRGLLDTDGYVSKSGTIQYSTSSKKLSKQIIYLSQSLGATANLSEKLPTYTYKGEKKQGRRHYIITIHHSKGIEFLTLSTKKDRVKSVKTRQKRNTISNISFTSIKPAQCIKVSHKDSLYITDNFIPTHNTSIAQDIILKASKQGKKCLFISLEVDKRNVLVKFLSNLGSVENWKIQKRVLNDMEKESLKDIKQEIKEMQIYVNDSSNLNIQQIDKIVKNQMEKQPVDLLVIDYVQIIKGIDTRGKNESIIIKESTTQLKTIAKKYDIGVLALAQINRKAVEGQSQEPTINDFKSSGGIEEDADVAIILHRDRNEGTEDGYFSNSGKLIIAKNRHGRTGSVNINFDGQFGRFNESNF